MGRSQILIFFILIIGLITAVSATIQAQNDINNFEFGFSERLRFVNWNNAVTLNNNADGANSFTRHRTSIWAKWKPITDMELYVKLTNEFRYYFKPDNKDFEIHEIIFDNLYVKLKPVASLPFTLTLGRQDIMLGEGFIVMDGNPLDGSRSVFFNAIRGEIQFNQNDNLTFFYFYQPVTDDILIPLNNREQILIEKPETAYGFYYKTKLNNSIGLDAYVINKKIDSTSQDSVDENFNTFGLRLDYPISERLSITAEAAYQEGTFENHARNSYGGYTHIDYSTMMNFPYPAKVTLGMFNLSGDDQGTKDNEGWDPIFSRWPKWSESYIYTQILENKGKVAYWSNTISIFASVAFDISKELILNFNYHHLMANEIMPGSSKLASGEGTTRGEILITKLNAKISNQLTGHLLLENFWPGNYYAPHTDGYYWFRCELMYSL